MLLCKISSICQARRKIARRLGAGPILIVKTDITNEIAVWLPVGGDGIGGEAVIRISHGDARHDSLILGDVSDFAHDIRSGYALAIDDGAKATIPGGENDAIAKRAEIEVADRAGIEDPVIGQHQRDRRIELPESP